MRLIWILADEGPVVIAIVSAEFYNTEVGSLATFKHFVELALAFCDYVSEYGLVVHFKAKSLLCKIKAGIFNYVEKMTAVCAGYSTFEN